MVGRGKVVLSGKEYFTEVYIGADEDISINKMTKYLGRLKCQPTLWVSDGGDGEVSMKTRGMSIRIYSIHYRLTTKNDSETCFNSIS